MTSVPGAGAVGDAVRAEEDRLDVGRVRDADDDDVARRPRSRGRVGAARRTEAVELRGPARGPVPDRQREARPGRGWRPSPRPSSRARRNRSAPRRHLALVPAPAVVDQMMTRPATRRSHGRAKVRGHDRESGADWRSRGRRGVSTGWPTASAGRRSAASAAPSRAGLGAGPTVPPGADLERCVTVFWEVRETDRRAWRRKAFRRWVELIRGSSPLIGTTAALAESFAREAALLGTLDEPDDRPFAVGSRDRRSSSPTSSVGSTPRDRVQLPAWRERAASADRRDARRRRGWRARRDSNPRPSGPQPDALSAELRAHAIGPAELAEREGFEPSKQVTPLGGLANRCTRPLCDLSADRAEFLPRGRPSAGLRTSR